MLNLRKVSVCGFVLLVILSQVASSIHVCWAASVIDIDVITDKQTYNAGETLRITGNVTKDGIIQNDTLAGVEIDFPNGALFFIRSVPTGNVSGMYWHVQITNLYTCDSMGNPQTLFSKGNLAYANLTVKNMDVVPHFVKAAICVQSSDNAPFQAFYPLAMDCAASLEFWTMVTIPIPNDTSTGEARIYANLFTDSPRNVGTPYCPERSYNFSIAATTPRMPVQPLNFNLTLALPQKDLKRGNYTVYATTSIMYQSAIEIKQFTVLGPVPIFTYYPINPVVCQTVIFDGSASYDVGGGSVIGWSWSFGDGSLATGAIANHLYELGGNYPVTLTVTDNDGGYNSTTLVINVIESWPMFRHSPNHSGNSKSPAPVTNMTEWIQVIGQPFNDIWMCSSPIVTATTSGNLIFMGSANGSIYCFDATQGTTLWARTPAPGFRFYSSSAFADSFVFIGSEDGRIYCLNATNGNTVFSVATGGVVRSSPAIVGSKVYIGSDDTKIYAFSTNGTSLWTSVALDAAIDSSPAVENGQVFVATLNGTMYSLNKTTGNVIWRTNLAPGTPVHSSPAFWYDKVFVGVTNNLVYALNAQNGSVQWSAPTTGGVYSSPAVAGNLVFVGSLDGNLYAFDASSGSLVWSRAIGQIKWSSPLVADGKVFVGTVDGKLLAVRQENGDIWWSYQTDGGFDCSPAVLNDTLFAGSRNGKLYAFWGRVHDVAIASVASSRTLIFQNETAIISTVVWNKGSFNEVVNLTTSCNSTAFDNRSISLNKGTESNVQIAFDTTGVPVGTYIVRVNATLLPAGVDYSPSDNTMTCQVRVVVGIHEINVTGVVVSTLLIDPSKPILPKTILGARYNATIYFNVKNEGNFTESDIHLNVYWSNSTHFNRTITSVTVSQLQVGASVMLNLSWNTEGLTFGNYTISVYALRVNDEDSVTNNLCLARSVRLVVPSDVTSAVAGVPDGKVDMRDVGAICGRFGTTQAGQEWDPNIDVNGDGRVDMRDIGISCQEYGRMEQG